MRINKSNKKNEKFVKSNNYFLETFQDKIYILKRETDFMETWHKILCRVSFLIHIFPDDKRRTDVLKRPFLL
jgi:hypothetical protein